MVEKLPFFKLALVTAAVGYSLSGCSGAPSDCSNAIVLKEGPHRWQSYIDGRLDKWLTAYSQGNLPVDSGDYGKAVKYQGKCFTLRRVFPYSIGENEGQIIVSEVH